MVARDVYVHRWTGVTVKQLVWDFEALATSLFKNVLDVFAAETG